MSFLFGRTFRAAARRLLGRSGIEAGGGGRRWEGAPVLTNAAQNTIAARQAVEKRAAALYVNNALASRAVEAWTSALVGGGWNARSRHPDPETARALNQAFESMIGPIMPVLAPRWCATGKPSCIWCWPKAARCALG